MFLINFYMARSHAKLEPVGFLSGKLNTETYGISSLDSFYASEVRNLLKSIDVRPKSERNEEGISFLFDLGESQRDTIEQKLADLNEEISLEKIDVLPSWAKKFLLRDLRPSYGGERDRYGREVRRRGDRDSSRGGGHWSDRGGSRYSDGGFMRRRGDGDDRNFSRDRRGSDDRRPRYGDRPRYGEPAG
jgi:hypothetical protein